MKKILLSLLILIVALKFANATVLTVSNNPTGGAQFATILAAYTSATNGDTLMLEGTPTNYDAPHPWGKQLVVIGTGYNPNKANTQVTLLSSFEIGSSGNNSKFYGIVFSQTVQTANAISNYYFENCRFDGAVNFHSPSNSINGLIMKNCIFLSNAHTPSQLSSNMLFVSCIFNGFLYGAGNQLCSSGWVTVDHCLFLSGGINLYDLFNAQITNSIFMNSTSITSGGGNTVFYNNIYRVATFNIPPSVGGSPNNGLNNHPSTDPNFVSYTLNSSYSQQHNYHLNTGSPAIGAATNGGDIGPHGSSTNFSETGEVLITPVIQIMTINNTVVAPNGTLNVQLNVRKPTDY